MWPLLDLLWQSTVVLGVTEAACRVSGRAAPAVRHRIRFAGVVLVFLLPAFAFVMPQWSFTRLAGATGLVQVSITTRSVGAAESARSMDLLSWALSVWRAGAILRFAPFASSYVRMRRLVRQAAKQSEPFWEEQLESLRLKLGLSYTPTLLVSRRTKVPMVFGLCRPVIALPEDCAQWTPGTRSSVLAHEMAHIRRADLGKHFLCILVASAWWFQPLLIWVLGQMRRDSELACDRMALQAGLAASDYATDLITLARSLRGLPSVRNAAIAMAGESDLETRVRALLSPLSYKPRRLLAFCSFALLVTTTMAASAIAVHPKQNIKSTGETMMRRLLPSALLIAAGLPAATPALNSPNTNMRTQASTSASRPVTKPRDEASASSGNSKPIRIGGDVQSAKLIEQVPPVYPAEARRNGIQGEVKLEVVITAEGLPSDIRVLASPSEEFSQSTLEAVRQWRYRPTLLNGQPVEVITEVRVNYTLAP